GVAPGCVNKPRPSAPGGGGGGPAVMSNGSLNTSRNPGAVACRVYPAPGLSMLREVHSATPPRLGCIETAPPPDSVPPPGLNPIERVTSPTDLRSWFPDASYTLTRTVRSHCPACAIE